MNKTETENRLRANYKSRIGEHLEQLKKDGYCLARDTDGNISVMQYDPKRNKFALISTLGEFHTVMDFKQIHNPFKFEIDNVEIIDEIFDHFQAVDISDLTSFARFEKNALESVDKKEIETDLKKLLSLSEKLGENADNKKPCTPHEQALLLARECVIFTGSDTSLSFTEIRKYYHWNKKQKKFVKLSPEDIKEMICDFWNLNHSEINVLDIEKSMRNIYPEIIVTEAFPVKWNNDRKIKREMKEDKKAHSKISKIVLQFE